MADSSGEVLFKRGYRTAIGVAPLNEVLAAGLVHLTKWNPATPLLDPMCGSGTILTEAAMMAAKIPPGYYRKNWSFLKWPEHQPQLFETIYQHQIEKISNLAVDILGSDISRQVLDFAKTNVEGAKLQDLIRLVQGDFFSGSNGGEKKPLLIFNPPYGERLNSAQSPEFYKNIGDTLKKQYKGSTAWILLPGTDALKRIGLKTSRKIPLLNGGLEVRFCRYDLY